MGCPDYVTKLRDVAKGTLVAAGEKKLKYPITVAAISVWYNGCLKV